MAGKPLGGALSCVAICEVLLHPSVRRPVGGAGVGDRGSGQIAREAPPPDKYWVVEDERHVRVVGLLLTAHAEEATSEAAKERSSSMVILFYGLGLALLGLCQSRAFNRWLLEVGRAVGWR